MNGSANQSNINLQSSLFFKHNTNPSCIMLNFNIDGWYVWSCTRDSPWHLIHLFKISIILKSSTTTKNVSCTLYSVYLQFQFDNMGMFHCHRLATSADRLNLNWITNIKDLFISNFLTFWLSLTWITIATAFTGMQSSTNCNITELNVCLKEFDFFEDLFTEFIINNWNLKLH